MYGNMTFFVSNKDFFFGEEGKNREKMKTERKVKLGKALLFVVLFTVLAFVSVGCTSETPPEEEWNKTFGENRGE